MTKSRGIRRPYEKHGHGGTLLYGVWQNMNQRCHNAKNKKFHLYGGRGITVCERWRTSFVSFISDMGERPAGTSIDHIDPNGNYEKSNCRWVTIAVQRANQRPPKLELHEHAQVVWLKSLGYKTAEIARFFDIDLSYVYMLVKRAKQAATTNPPTS